MIKGRYIGPEESLKGMQGRLQMNPVQGLSSYYVAAEFWDPVTNYWHGPHYLPLADFKIEEEPDA